MQLAKKIDIRGLVQGIGFRPFVYRVACETGITGWVINTNEGVEIFAQGTAAQLSHFRNRLRREAPAASAIERMTWKSVPPGSFSGFDIRPSEDRSSAVTGISPDIAVCQECLDDMAHQPHRLDYPFINCTHCGPRFSIIRDLPYDRPKTSMEVFPMCDRCRSEYEDVLDRRFHAQPVACLHCGPGYTLISGEERITDLDQILKSTALLLEQGKIVAIKGTGGYHLACNPFDEPAVRSLRERKIREGKPLALMFRDLEAIRAIAVVSRIEKASLLSWRRPIVILKLRKNTMNRGILKPVNSGLSTIGAFLPYMPFHYQLFRHFSGPAIVLTSGNVSSEPIACDEEEAFRNLGGIADAFVIHNREIVNRCDDSVVQIISGRERLIRRSRGYVPSPLATRLETEGIVSLGAELSGCFCLGKEQQAIMGQFAGDLDNLATQAFFGEAMSRMERLFRIRPSVIACDLHPGYHTTCVAESFRNMPVVRVQHHHAHIASCMIEHGLDEQVIGVAFDGTGYGTDGKIWGAEFLVCDLAEFRRLSHFDYIPLPGGDKAVEQPWRTAVACLYRTFGREFLEMPLPVKDVISREKEITVMNMIDKGIGCPEVSSAGRLFDAVAAILGICPEAGFHAEGPMRLESIAVEPGTTPYPFKVGKVIRLEPLIRELVRDCIAGVPSAHISSKFHQTLISIIFEQVTAISRTSQIRKVVLSGGVFQNRYLLEGAIKTLKDGGLTVYSNERFPANDGGIALGQLAVAAKRRAKGCV